MAKEDSKATPWWRSLWLKLVVLASVVALGGLLYWQYREQLQLSYVADREADLRQALQEHPAVFYSSAFVVYVVVTGLSIPGAAVLTLTYGWLFGFWPALILVSFASTTGATIAFLLSRFLIGETIQRRYGERLGAFNRALEEEGPFFLFTLRLVPVVPFFVINLLMGLTPIRARTFWWVSQLGMLPGTCVYVFAGSSVPTAKELVEKGAASLLTPQLILAFVILGVFPLIVRYGMKLFGRRRP